ncbi:unnamed protein product [Effrenium voratum]|nr:unnamed protein product [Effrenium voratum]
MAAGFRRWIGPHPRDSFAAGAGPARAGATGTTGATGATGAGDWGVARDRSLSPRSPRSPRSRSGPAWWLDLAKPGEIRDLSMASEPTSFEPVARHWPDTSREVEKPSLDIAWPKTPVSSLELWEHRVRRADQRVDALRAAVRSSPGSPSASHAGPQSPRSPRSPRSLSPRSPRSRGVSPSPAFGTSDPIIPALKAASRSGWAVGN